MENEHGLGLSSIEAAQRLKEYGPNTLPGRKRRTLLTIILDVIREPMFILLFVATILYLLLGELQEGLALTTFVALIIAITLYQQGKTEKALQKLRALTSPRALAIRDGKPNRISGSDVVPDDVIMINEGDRIPADGLLISANDLQIDESLLTGESLPVFKKASPQKKLAISQENNMYLVYAGTMVAQGQGTYRVQATGKNTAMGKIGVSLQTLKTEISPLQRQVSKLVKIFAIIGLVVSILLVVLLGILQHDWLNASLSGIALAMSLLPEEFPVILTIFPALGAWRLSKQNMLTRRISAIETLGAISVLCVDKTGTITENQMSVSQLWVEGEFYHLNESKESLPEKFHSLIEFGILASELKPFDPMEKAFHQIGNLLLSPTEHIHPDWLLVQDYDLSSELRAKTHVWTSNQAHHYVVAAKGAPEAIMELCQIHNESQHPINLAIKEMADKGLRVLGVARADFQGESWPSSQRGFQFNFIGVVGFTDPVRTGIPEAVQECHDAGIRVIMITGDYAVTANAIARQANISSQNILIGAELESMNDSQLREKIKSTSICARITPEQKLRIVQAIKKQGNIVAMTGDGVNDAPALKSAHVGIAMGKRGTDVAREASALVLTDDNFTSIVAAIARGRNIFDNIKKSMSYILAIHVPIAGLALLPVLLGWPAFFYPMHIAFLQLIIDPACSISFENEPPEDNLMKRQPRDPHVPLIDKNMLIFCLLQGMGIFFICLLTYHFALDAMTEPQARAFTFVSLVIANIMLIFSNRTVNRTLFFSPMLNNKILNWITLSTLAFLALSIYLPFLSKLFQFAPLSARNLAFSVGIGIASVLWYELIKLIKNVAK